ncbi:unnamed protein product [Hyaloperonospora brassicae]|uniref:DIRP domain-containing protein n=1 Tax=Hyaloperonospora brassicae TaxID=162125 RepID=A0AAV0UHI0_HYABA|nr:unnamed protein product [Hyaloperonospora brassicae]
MQSEQVLGPRWSLTELRTFYVLLKAHGQQWDLIVERLPHRLVGMVRALFEMHRGYLSLAEASVEGFCAIMTDHYDTQDKQRTICMADEKLNKCNVADLCEPKHDEEAARDRKKRRLETFMVMKHVKTSRGQAKNHNETRWALRPEVRLALEPLVLLLRGRSGRRYERPWCRRRRRLSLLFLAQQKQKLEAYRFAKRRIDATHMPDDKTCPYRCTAVLRPGTTVIARVESERRFQLATVVEVHATAGACQVAYFGSDLEEDVVECSLDSVMALDLPLWSGRSKNSMARLKAAATTLVRRRNHELHGSTSTPVTSNATDSVSERHREKKCRAVLAVKALLHRKERIILAMANLNERVAAMQLRSHEKSAVKSSVWNAPAISSSAAVKDLAWTNSHTTQQLRKQHSWLAANLDATNVCLKAALLSLQSFSQSDYCEEGEDLGMNDGDTDDALEEGSVVPDETLTESQMRWAIDFLDASRRKATTVVAESALQIAKDDEELRTSSTLTNGIRPREVLPETMHLVANCVTLMSVLHRHVVASPDVPPIVTQKLVERVLESLKPTYNANMDLYAELHAAADAVQAQMAQQTSASKVD